jgi:hypothetical protein
VTSLLFKTHACLLMIGLDGLLDSLAIKDCDYLMLWDCYKEDVRLDHSVPHINITPNAHRRLKNSASKRMGIHDGQEYARVQEINNSIIKQTRKPQLSVNFDGCGFDLLDSRDNYLKLKGHNKSSIFHRITERNIEYAIVVIGNKYLVEDTTTDDASFKDALLARSLTVRSVKRIF